MMYFDPGAHAPGHHSHHVLPAAGERSGMESADSEVFRYNRVTPYYPSDPCIRPNEADLICRPERPDNQNHLLPSAGINTAYGDTFSHYRVNPPLAAPECSNSRPVSGLAECPCTNRCKPRKYPPGYDLRLMYPACADRPATPHFTTPIYNYSSPYFTPSSVAPHVFVAPASPCREPWSRHLLPDCPGAAPRTGGDLALFLRCYNDTTQ